MSFGRVYEAWRVWVTFNPGLSGFWLAATATAGLLAAVAVIGFPIGPIHETTGVIEQFRIVGYKSPSGTLAIVRTGRGIFGVRLDRPNNCAIGDTIVLQEQRWRLGLRVWINGFAEPSCRAPAH